MTVAALYVQTGGVYYGLDDVDPWDEARDARTYDGPWPVVAHPPCARWCALAGLVESMHGYKVGDDGGCFALALSAVRRFGGVLEHPARSLAWDRFGLPTPTRHGWGGSLFESGIACEIDQAAYGHPARKRTWLYAVGVEPAPLDWSRPPVTRMVSSLGYKGRNVPETERVRPALASRTPEPFRDVLLAMARSARPEVVAGIAQRRPTRVEGEAFLLEAKCDACNREPGMLMCALCEALTVTEMFPVAQPDGDATHSVAHG